MSNFPRGSEWRRWDLHIHTPESALANEFRDWDYYLECLENADSSVKVIGVTDYASIEGYKRVLSEKSKGRLGNFSLIIPNVEFRIFPYTRDGKGVNIHLLLDPTDGEHVERIEDALSRLLFLFNEVQYSCTKNGLIRLGKAFKNSIKDDQAAFRAGVNQFKPSYDTFKKWFESEKWIKDNGLVAICNGGGDGASGLAHDDGFAATRTQIYRFGDVVFSGKPADRKYFLGKGVDSVEILNGKIGGIMPCIHGSDAHKEDKLFKPDEDRYCWIKSDPTFEGLRQIIYEPEARVHIGATVPEAKDEAKIIDSLSIAGASEWFPAEVIPLNSSLVTIIGSKGSGKTALADMIAYAAGAWDRSKASFLTKAFKEISGAEITSTWKCGATTSATVASPSTYTPKEVKVKYLSQQFVETLCSDDHVGTELLKEIENVVFEYLDETDRLGETNFAGLRAAKTKTIREERQRIRLSVQKLNQEIYELFQEINLRPDKADKISFLMKEKDGLIKQTPVFDSAEEEEATAALSRLRDQRQYCVTEISVCKKNLEYLNSILSESMAFMDTIREFYKDISKRLYEVGISGDAAEAFTVAFKGDITGIIKERVGYFEAKAKTLTGDDNNPSEQPGTLVEITRQLRAQEEKLVIDQAKKHKIMDIQRRSKEIDVEISKLQEAIRSIDDTKIPEMANKKSERMEKYLTYFDNLKKEQEILSTLYSPLGERLVEGSDQEKKLEFYIKWNVDVDTWASVGEQQIDQRKTGPYRSSGTMAAKAKELLGEPWQGTDIDKIQGGLEEFVASFYQGGLELKTQLLAGTNECKFEDWLYSTDHLSLSYGIKFDGTELENLSPGSKGIALLILYLEMDRHDNMPLIIDQPEENLDNESIYKVLTSYFKAAKSRRQIVMITHNPNLVVNTDSEQVIVASFSRQPAAGSSKINYKMGSLEDTKKKLGAVGIREKVCEILEGGELAFHKREQKYAFSRT